MQISVLKYKLLRYFKSLHGKPSPANTNVSFIWSFVGSVNCRQAFLFSLVNPSALRPTKLSLITGKEGKGIYCDSNYGPVFGDGSDLYISNNANTRFSGGLLGHTYQLPLGQRSTFFTRSQSFTVTDYEVFGFQQWQNTSRKGSCGQNS